jgi:hypothetical protein
VSGRGHLAAHPGTHGAGVEQGDDSQEVSCARRTGW